MPARKLPPDLEVAKLYREGKSSGEIAALYGVKPVTVISCLRLMGEPRRSLSEAQRLSFAHGREPLRYWKGKKQPREMVERRIAPIRGEGHWLWKGGASIRAYRKIVQKDQCSLCDSKCDLGIHHIDGDHFNNDPKNLQVLCNSCHISLHKTAYWKAYRGGIPTPHSNGPVGWTKKGGNNG